jgi:hypothetical protein
LNPDELLRQLSTHLWKLVGDAAEDLASGATNFPIEENAPPPLRGRLLVAFDVLPATNPLAEFAAGVLGELPAGDRLRLHGWERAPGATKGVALVATEGDSRAALALTPGDPPKIDVVVTAGQAITVATGEGAWKAKAEISTNVDWDAELSPGAAPPAVAGRAQINLLREEPLTIGLPQGPGVSARKIDAELLATAGSATSFVLTVEGFQAALLPEELAAFLGAGGDRSTAPTQLRIQADAAGGLRFEGSGVRVELPGSLSLPGVSARGMAVELEVDQAGLQLKPTIGLRAKLPGFPVEANLDGVGISVPFALNREAFGPSPDGIPKPPLPTGIGIDLTLPPVGGGGAVRKTETGGYAGVLDLDLAMLRIQALGVVQLPTNADPTSVLALLAAVFPYPGIQLGFGFALDAVGGLVGINRRVDIEALTALVGDGNADHILFPENAVERAEEITRSLDAVFPVKRGRTVVAPMVRINWSGRIVTFSGALILDLPSPPQIVLLGRLLVAVPDPAAPLIRLQASVLGRIDPALPETELLVSLAGSWIVMTPVSGEIYLLVRGGDQAVFVLSAGGFHPRYTRPPGVPALERLTMDLGGGYLGLSAEAYLAVTSSALMFGAKLQLDATIAGCGVEGQLGLDALFVWEPTFSFSVHVYASVAVRAFGRRLASVGLDFTLEGPAPWHAFGTGSISILFWDVSLDFDVRWGEAPRTPLPAPEILPLLEKALLEPSAWTAERPLEQRNGVRLSERAKADLVAGKVVQADATLRVSQNVVPLAEPITRFARTRVPAQRWDMFGDGAGITERFVPGEFFDLSEEQQLTAPAFTEAKSGVSLSDKDVLLGSERLVEDTYETKYEVEPEFQEGDPGISFNFGIASFGLERFAYPIAPDERLGHWRSAQEALSSGQVAFR